LRKDSKNYKCRNKRSSCVNKIKKEDRNKIKRTTIKTKNADRKTLLENLKNKDRKRKKSEKKEKSSSDGVIS
jgi:hypothetical protein